MADQARLLIADHLIKSGRTEEATALLRVFFAEQAGREYDSLTLLSVAGLLARGALRSDSGVNDADVQGFVKKVRGLVAQFAASGEEPNPARMRYRISTSHSLFFLEPRQPRRDLEPRLPDPGELQRGWWLRNDCAAVAAPDD